IAVVRGNFFHRLHEGIRSHALSHANGFLRLVIDELPHRTSSPTDESGLRNRTAQNAGYTFRLRAVDEVTVIPAIIAPLNAPVEALLRPFILEESRHITTSSSLSASSTSGSHTEPNFHSSPMWR